MAAPQSVRDGSDTGQADTPDGCAGGRHRLRVVGYVRGRGPAWLDCARPLHVVCRDCDHVTRWACSGHRESRCKPCAGRYRRRVRTVALSGTRRQSGFHYFLTLTAPGDRQHRQGKSGDWCECTPAGGVDLGRWNASHSARWNHLRTLLRRELSPSLEYFRGVEVQGRGALHDHALMWSPVPLRKRDVKELAMRAGFGHSVDLVECVPGSKRASYYVSKYVTKSTDLRSAVPWWGQTVDYATGEVLDGLVDDAPYRTWSQSRAWGIKMAEARADARAYVAKLEAERDVAGAALLLASFPGAVVTTSETPPAPS
jgi:hypothetical protein